jgi:hypothetical protein
MPLAKCLAAVSEPGGKSSAIYRHASSKDGFPELEVKTLYDLFKKSAEKYPNRPALGRRVVKVRPAARSRAHGSAPGPPGRPDRRLRRSGLRWAGGRAATGALQAARCAPRRGASVRLGRPRRWTPGGAWRRP